MQFTKAGLYLFKTNRMALNLKAIIIFFGLFMGFTHGSIGQKGYSGTLITKFGDTLTGFIAFKMDKPNDEMIEVTTTSTVTSTTGNGTTSKTKETGGAKINAGIINYIKIGDSVYYFRDVKVKNQTSKYDRNMCLRLTTGSLRNGIFQIGNSNNPEKAVISLPGKNNTYLVSPQDDYYAQTSGWCILEYSDCNSLKQKIREKQPGYIWNKDVPLENRLALWRNWIIEYEACPNKQ
jgi:hypothetical protein